MKSTKQAVARYLGFDGDVRFTATETETIRRNDCEVCHATNGPKHRQNREATHKVVVKCENGFIAKLIRLRVCEPHRDLIKRRWNG